MLVLRLILVPLLIAAVSIATRKWGTRVGGLLMAMPVVAGPTIAIYAIAHGNLFAAAATEATLIGLVAVAAFCVSYARCAARWRWPISLLAGWLAFGAVAALLYRLSFGLAADLVVAVTALLAARRLIPDWNSALERRMTPAWDLPLRMACAAGLVFTLTSLASRLGPNASGILTPFPVAIAIITAFTHAQAGPGAARQFLREFIPGLCTFAVFCFVLAQALRSLNLLAAFGLALAVQLALQAAILQASVGRGRLNPSHSAGTPGPVDQAVPANDA